LIAQIKLSATYWYQRSIHPAGEKIISLRLEPSEILDVKDSLKVNSFAKKIIFEIIPLKIEVE